MPQVRDIMSHDPETISPEETLQRAAQIMLDLDIGALPVCDGKRVVGMVTDRDIAVRGVAAGLAPDQGCVSDVMTPEVECVSPDQDAEEVMQLMGDAQVRRLPVVNEDDEIIGIVSLGDLATRQDGHTDEALREISEPGGNS
ncbi:MAG: CBS domain-containing protein [Burkholderiales bacterium]|jgi:CBS domain-containing protein|nr:CBS domain-containing protein [Burkholderiales bacterium]